MTQSPPSSQAQDVVDIRAVARGDQAALGALYDRHGGLMMALGHRFFRGRREAEDVLHDVFVEIWKRAGDYDPRRGSVKTWMVLRMRSRCLDRVRSAGYARAESLDGREEAALRRASGPEAGTPDAEAAADASRLPALLRELPAEQRAVLTLGYFHGLSSSEIAARLEIPIGTVKSRVRAAMARLRDTLGVVT